MEAIIWLRRLLVALTIAASLLALLGVYVLVDALLRVALIGGYSCFVQAVLWADRRLTGKLQQNVFIYAVRLRAMGHENAIRSTNHASDQG